MTRTARVRVYVEVKRNGKTSAVFQVVQRNNNTVENCSKGNLRSAHQPNATNTHMHFSTQNEKHALLLLIGRCSNNNFGHSAFRRFYAYSK